MKFIDFCTDVVAVGVTVVLALVAAGGVASSVEPAGPAPAEPPPVALTTPDVTIPRPAAVAETVRETPRPLDLSDLERSLDALLGPRETAPAVDMPVVNADAPLIDLLPEPAPAPVVSTDPTPEVDWTAVLSDAITLPDVLPVDRPDTTAPAPATRPLIAAPRPSVTDFMADLLDDRVEELPAPPSASRPLGRFAR